MPEVLFVVRNILTNNPIPGANITVQNLDLETVWVGTTDSAGMAGPWMGPPGFTFRVSISAVGYEPYGPSGLTLSSANVSPTYKLSPTTPPPPATYTLVISSGANGTTSPSPGTYSHSPGDVITVTALPHTGYEVEGWTLDGADKGNPPALSVAMDADHVTHVTFRATAPPPPPPEPPPGEILVWVKDAKTGAWLPGAKAELDSLVVFVVSGGYAHFGSLPAKTYQATVSLGGYDTSTASIPLAAGGSVNYLFNLSPTPALDPWSGLLNWVKGLWDGLLGALTGFTRPIQAGMKGLADSALDEAQKALGTESPDPVTAVKAKALAEQLQRRQTEILGQLHRSPLDLSQAPGAAGLLASGLIGAQLAIEILTTVADNLHPIRSTRIVEVAQRISDALGFGGIVSQITMMPTEVGLLPQLRYWYQSQFTPLIPPTQDLTVMLVRETITPDEFNANMAMHGFSRSWANRYWDVHWRLPSPESVTDAFHRGLISAQERDVFLVLHDYRPGPRPGIARADRDIVAGLQKTLVTRVDLRRGWELGRVSDERLLQGMQALGYEDDAELVAEIQRAMALEGERNAVARPAGRAFRDGKIGEADYRKVLATLDVLGERQDLWVLRYLWERKSPPTAAETAAEAAATA